jgi:hypothetical protein
MLSEVSQWKWVSEWQSNRAQVPFPINPTASIWFSGRLRQIVTPFSKVTSTVPTFWKEVRWAYQNLSLSFFKASQFGPKHFKSSKECFCTKIELALQFDAETSRVIPATRLDFLVHRTRSFSRLFVTLSSNNIFWKVLVIWYFWAHRSNMPKNKEFKAWLQKVRSAAQIQTDQELRIVTVRECRSTRLSVQKWARNRLQVDESTAKSMTAFVGDTCMPMATRNETCKDLFWSTASKLGSIVVMDGKLLP